ncbi:MAG: hypothetical protein KKF62_17705 [Bacteroidetes bacterium]|nr:hypothetical protein [Bacteroidota bacterium]MBU1113545.1 hypothetical protein [Bacteroidota bacterium]MBU1800331.1 hypothetical protein [Bacteroidota bacterium]
MKRVLLIVAVVSLGIWGCSGKTNLTEPGKDNAQNQILKFNSSPTSQLMKTAVSKKIDGKVGGKIEIDFRSEDKSSSVIGELVFPANSFNGEKSISISLAGDLAALDFEPSMSFNNSVSLSLSFKGVNVDDKDKVGFNYIGENGKFYSVDYNTLIVNATEYEVTVDGAELNHFSRYGFTK